MLYCFYYANYLASIYLFFGGGIVFVARWINLTC